MSAGRRSVRCRNLIWLYLLARTIYKSIDKEAIKFRSKNKTLPASLFVVLCCSTQSHADQGPETWGPDRVWALKKAYVAAYENIPWSTKSSHYGRPTCKKDKTAGFWCSVPYSFEPADDQDQNAAAPAYGIAYGRTDADRDVPAPRRRRSRPADDVSSNPTRPDNCPIAGSAPGGMNSFDGTLPPPRGSCGQQFGSPTPPDTGTSAAKSVFDMLGKAGDMAGDALGGAADVVSGATSTVVDVASGTMSAAVEVAPALIGVAGAVAQRSVPSAGRTVVRQSAGSTTPVVVRSPPPSRPSAPPVDPYSRSGISGTR